MNGYNPRHGQGPSDEVPNPFEQLEELRQALRHQGRKIFGFGLVVLALLGLGSSFYQVEAGHLGVLTRFGRHIDNVAPGPHFRLPFGIDKVFFVAVDRQHKMEFGFRTVRAGIESEFRKGRKAAAESEMLTGDLNVGIVEWIVQYKIQSPEKYLFRFRDISTTLRLMSEAAMRSVVGDHSIDELITLGREEIERKAKDLLIDLNRRYDTGIAIVQLKLKDANVPDAVKPALREVEEAKQVRERRNNEALAEYNKVIPAARGIADQLIDQARGYAVERINQAEGDANRFASLVAEYRKAPEVTRTRLYLETMNGVLPKVKNKILVDTGAKSLLPLLHLGGGQGSAK